MASSPPRRKAPATAALARQLYAEGVPIAEICTRTGLSTGVAYRWIDREVEDDGTVSFKPIGRRAGRSMPQRTEQTPRARLLARLWRAAERQVVDIEARLNRADGGDRETPPRPAAEAEKDARALALIARTVRELVAAEDDASLNVPKDADESARDLDAFRFELARRLERLRAGEAGGGEPVPE